MTLVNTHEAKTHLSKLLQLVAEGETFVIAKSGKPIAKLTGYQTRPSAGRLGFLKGQATVPENFDELLTDEITELFGS